MKKVTKIVTLAAATMCAFAVVGASFAATAGARARANATAAEWRNIQYIADSRIKVSGPEMAKAGTKVAFSLEYNHRNFEVTGVRVGNGYAAEMDDSQTDFYFVMPNEDTDVVVEYIDYTAPAEESYSILNVNAENGLFLNGAPAYAKPGDVITFSISMAADSPLRFNGACDLVGVDADGSSTGALEWDNVGDNQWTFTMPASDVAVYTYVEAKYFFLTFPEEQLQYVKTVKYKDKIGELGLKGEARYNDPEGYFLPFYADVEIEFKNSLYTAVKGVKVNEQELTFENTLKVKFSMPGKDIQLELVTDDYYRTVVADGGEDAFYPASENYDFEILKQNAETNEFEEFDGQAVYGDVVRAYITPKDDQRIAKAYDVVGVNGTSATSVYFTTGTANEKEYVQFTVGDFAEFYVCVKTENVKIAANHPILGSYVGCNSYSTNAQTYGAVYSASIDDWGNANIRGYSYTVALDGANSPLEGDGRVLVNGLAGRYALYGDNFFVCAWTPSNGTAYSYDTLVFYKNANATFRYMLNRTSFCALEALVDGAVVARLFYTLGNGSGIQQFYATGVQFEFTNGSSVNDMSAVYDVKVNGTKIATVNGNTYTAA